MIGKKFMKDSEILGTTLEDDDDLFYLEDLLSYFGYSFRQGNYVLPHTTCELGRLEEFLFRWKERLHYVNMLVSEAARREFLIAPVLLEVVRHTRAKVKMEFPLIVNEYLKRRINYCLQAGDNLLIIKGNKEDVDRGFIQLALELVALDRWTDSHASKIYGVVFTSKVWQFAILERQTKQVIQDVNLFRVPTDVEELLRIFVAILSEENT